MNDLILRGAVAADQARRNFVASTRERAERGDIVQTVLIIAMFVLVVVVVGGMFYNAIVAQGEKVTNCIENSNAGACSDFQER